MEEVPPARRGRNPRFVVLALLAAGLVLAWIALRRVPPERLVAPGVPRVRLAVDVVDRHGERAPDSRIASGAGVEIRPTATPAEENVASGWWQRRPTPTPEPAERDDGIAVRRAPIAVSVYVLDGETLLDWVDENPSARAFLGSDLARGAFADLLQTLQVRGEDLKIPDVRGPFLLALARDVVAAGATLHYDHSRGHHGYVLVFDRARSSIASRMLPVIVAAVAAREYQLARPQASVIEVVVGQQRLFIAEVEGRVYLGTSLPAVLNVIDLDPSPPAEDRGTVAVRLRAQGWLADLVPAMTGAEEFEATWTIDLGEPSPGVIATSGATFFDLLQPELAPGVLASIPRDAFAAVAASAPFPQLVATADGRRFVPEPGAKRAGIGLVWDLVQRDELISDVGIAAAVPRDRQGEDLAPYVSERSFAGKCAADGIWIAASSEPLLARMREACERQSLGMLDRLPAEQAESLPQIFAALNPAAGLSEMVERGIGAAVRDRQQAVNAPLESIPDWKRSYDAAIESARTSAAATLGILPVMVFQGAATRDGANLTGAFEPQSQLARRVP